MFFLYFRKNKSGQFKLDIGDLFHSSFQVVVILLEHII
jgi:hypothetical protein